MNEFLAMGGYAAYVWPAYGAALALLGGMTIHSLRRHRAATRALERIERARQR